MMDPKIFDDLARRLVDAVPDTVTDLKRDMEKNFKALLQSSLARLDLVTREEFDAQAAVLARTRSRLDALARQVAELEGNTLPRP